LNASGTIAAIQAGFRSIGVTGSSAALVIIGHPNDLNGLPSAMEESNGRTQRKMGVNDQQKNLIVNKSVCFWGKERDV
jgi:hypothetical protein